MDLGGEREKEGQILLITTVKCLKDQDELDIGFLIF